MTLLCKIGIHAKVQAAEPNLLSRLDLYRCRRCPAQWRIGSYGYSWGVVRYRDRLADAAGPYDHAAAEAAEEAQHQAYLAWRAARL